MSGPRICDASGNGPDTPAGRCRRVGRTGVASPIAATPIPACSPRLAYRDRPCRSIRPSAYATRRPQLRDQGRRAGLGHFTRIAAGLPAAGERRGKRTQLLIVLAVLAAVIVLDQATKWWAWRHVSGAEINPGGDLLAGRTVGGWYGAPVPGALLDLLDFGLLSIAISILVRRRRPAAVVIPGTLMLGGWSSNLLDRLGMHYWTAPGSARGAVDFIHIAWNTCNVADFFIVGATPLFLLALGYLGVRALNRRATVAAVARATRNRARARASTPALVCTGLIMVAVALGAANYSGVSTAPAPGAANYSAVSTPPAHVSATGH
jgi:lipoprotein signal peptidase